MRADVGDVLRFTGRKIGTAEHRARVVEVLGPEGEAPYGVRWDDGRETEIFPGPGCVRVRRVVIAVEQKAVSVEVTPDGYTVSCPGTDVVGHGPTEADAWLDFWKAVRADWHPPGEMTLAASGGRLPHRGSWMRIRTIRVRDFLG